MHLNKRGGERDEEEGGRGSGRGERERRESVCERVREREMWKEKKNGGEKKEKREDKIKGTVDGD